MGEVVLASGWRKYGLIGLLLSLIRRGEDLRSGVVGGELRVVRFVGEVLLSYLNLDRWVVNDLVEGEPDGASIGVVGRDQARELG